MENQRITRRGVEENTMAILDSSGTKDARDIHDDRLSFLEAVRGSSLVSDSSTVPTWKMYDAVFQIFRDGASLELVMSSYQILTELDQRYPRVCLPGADKPAPVESRNCEIVVVKEAWSPFVVALENMQTEGEDTFRNSKHLIDSDRFSLLVQEIAQAVSKTDSQINTKHLKDMLLLEYLVNVLNGDFLPRQSAYKGTMNWVLLRESLLNMLLGSRRLSFKAFIRDCLSVIYKSCHLHTVTSLHDLKRSKESMSGTDHECDVALAFVLSELEKKTCNAVQKLLMLIMELDVIKKEADMLGNTSRADSVRTPLLEIILDELTYDKDLVSPFLQGFSDSKWKLEIILQYIWKYCYKPPTRTRSSSKSSENATLEGVLTYFSNAGKIKSIVRKITVEVARLLLAHAFQAYLSLNNSLKHVAKDNQNSGGSCLLHVSKGIISAFQNLKKIDEDMDILDFEKEAIFTAEIILRMKS